MKKIQYKILSYQAVFNEETGEMDVLDHFVTVTTDHSPVAEADAAKKAHKGEYEIFHVDEESVSSDQQNILETQAAYTAIMTDPLPEV